MSIRGWIYVIVNEAMPNILKIGYSTKDPTLRARELAGTGSPHQFRVVFDALVEEPRTVEQAAHATLASKREGKEWFRCSHSEAIAAIRSCAKSILVERNNIEDHQNDDVSSRVHEQGPHEAQKPICCYFNCSKFSTQSYKGVAYCDEHYKAMRKMRFEFARSIRYG